MNEYTLNLKKKNKKFSKHCCHPQHYSERLLATFHANPFKI